MPPKGSALIVEGEKSQFEQLIPLLESCALAVHRVHSSAEALEHMLRLQPQLVLMDLLIDRRDATELLEELLRLPPASVATFVVLSERKENYVQVTALNAGADDFLVKPVNKRVFVSRVGAWLRWHDLRKRGAGNGPQGRGEVVLDEEKYSANVRDREVYLQRKEFEIMTLLTSKPRKVFSRDEIKSSVWLDAQGVRNRTIDVHIRNLRSKLGAKYIKTYKGIGYAYEG